MMKKLLKGVLGAIALLSLHSMAFADTKIGVLDLREILQKAPQIAVSNTELQKQFKPRNDKIVAAEKELQAKIDKLNRDGAVMSETERSQLQDKIITEKATLGGMIASFRKDLNDAQNKAMQKLMTQINGIVAKIGTDGKYSLIMVRDASAYFDKTLDITPQVIQQLGKK